MPEHVDIVENDHERGVQIRLHKISIEQALTRGWINKKAAKHTFATAPHDDSRCEFIASDTVPMPRLFSD